jgi:hypothetical protein
MKFLLSVIDSLKQKKSLQIFTIYLRYLIGGAFVMAAIGMGKFSNQELRISQSGTPIQDLLPIQQFFRVMSTSGIYWNFIGWSQLIGGFLLMSQRFAKLGAVLFFGLILNIFVITVSFGFNGTPVVTGLMLLATTWLLIWDLDAFQFILRRPTVENIFSSTTLPIIEHKYWSIVGVFMFVTIILLAVLSYKLPVQLTACFIEGLIAFILFFAFQRTMLRVQQP